MLHADRRWGFAFWYPSDWHRFNLPPGRAGVLYAPKPDDSATSFSVEVKDVGTRITGEDVGDLEAGFLEGLRSLPGCQIESHEHWVVAALVGLEARYTFHEGEATRQRWVRLLYEGMRQFHVVAQGATPEEYAYWLPMLFEMMMTLTID
jgi:hypothetical protein